MSVLKSRRNISRAEFVKGAHDIMIETQQFLSRLSARYSRMMSKRVLDLVYTVSDSTAAANAVMPMDEERFIYRKNNLIAAKGALNALDYALTDVYSVLLKNPEGAFSTRHGNMFSPNEAVERLEKMADSLGNLIDDEFKLLDSILKSDKERYENVKKIQKTIVKKES